MKFGLTKRQNDIFHFIREYLEREGFPPTIQEICDAFGFASTNGVSQTLQALERKGYIRRIAKGASRGLQILNHDNADNATNDAAPEGIKKLTIIGKGSADNALSVFLAPQGQVRIDTEFFDGDDNMFASVIEDNSMSSMGILQGDVAIIRQDTDPRNNSLVLALVRDTKLIRTYISTRAGFELRAAAKGFPTMKFSAGDDSVALLGVVIGVLRSLP